MVCRHFGSPFGSSFQILWEEVTFRIVGTLPSPLSIRPIEILGSDLAHSVLAHLYGRARLFMTIPGRSHILCPPNPADLGTQVLNVFEGMDLTDSSEAKTNQSSVPLGFGYSKELIDALVAVAQPLVSLFPTPDNARLLKRVWNFVGLFVLPSVGENLTAKPPVPASVFDSAPLLSATSNNTNTLIPIKTAAQLHAQTTLLNALFWVFNSSLRPCEAFQKEKEGSSMSHLSHSPGFDSANAGYKLNYMKRAGLQVSIECYFNHCLLFCVQLLTSVFLLCSFV